MWFKEVFQSDRGAGSGPGQPPANINQPRVSSPVLPIAPAPRCGPGGPCSAGCLRGDGSSASLPGPRRLSLLQDTSAGVKAVCGARGCHLQNAAGWAVRRCSRGISKL